MDIQQICGQLECTESEWQSILSQKSLNTEMVMSLSLLLEYDFFRIYSQHLILYSPQTNNNYNNVRQKSSLSYSTKNIYMIEVIEFILEQLANGNKTKKQIMSEYRIPRTTIHRWLNKYGQSKKDDREK